MWSKNHVQVELREWLSRAGMTTKEAKSGPKSGSGRVEAGKRAANVSTIKVQDFTCRWSNLCLQFSFPFSGDPSFRCEESIGVKWCQNDFVVNN